MCFFAIKVRNQKSAPQFFYMFESVHRHTRKAQKIEKKLLADRVKSNGAIFRIWPQRPLVVEIEIFLLCKLTGRPRLIDKCFTHFLIGAISADLQLLLYLVLATPILTFFFFWAPTRPHQAQRQKVTVHKYPHRKYFGLGNPAHQSWLELVRPYAKNKKSGLLKSKCQVNTSHQNVPNTIILSGGLIMKCFCIESSKGQIEKHFRGHCHFHSIGVHKMQLSS